MGATVLSAGLACLIAAILGGGLKAFGIEIPVMQSLARQISLGVLGALLITISFRMQPNEAKGDAAAGPSQTEQIDPLQGKLALSCLAGSWVEDQAATGGLRWDFSVQGQSLQIKRVDNFASGTFSGSFSKLAGAIHWGNGDTWEGVELYPKSCSEVRTNQAWSYGR